MNSLSKWIVTGAVLLLIQGADAREWRGPPQPCQPPKVDCCKPKCPKPKCYPCKPKADCCPKKECCPEPCPQPCPPTQICPEKCPDPCCPPWPVPVLHAAYNYPAILKTRCPWDVYLEASFIYWQPIEENLDLGYVSENEAPFTTPYAVGSPLSAESVKMDFDYKPGFQVAAGVKFDYDNWDARLGYTWFHNSHNTSESVTGTEGAIFANQGMPASGTLTLPAGVGSGTGSNLFDSASAEWQLKLDTIDLDLGRWHYVGTKLTYRPNVGLRAAFIRQYYDATYTNSSGFAVGFDDVQSISKTTKSWAIGPKFGLDTNWMLGAGFRFIGNGEADVLYTRYTTLSFEETHTAVSGGGVSVITSADIDDASINSLRAHVDLELGFGWGMYFNCNKWYLDIAATYGFQIFWDQNMFRKFTDDVNWLNSIEPNGNLYIHGLNLTFKVDF